MALSDTVSTIIGGGGLVALVGAATIFIRTLQQRGQIKADVLDSLSGTAAEIAESARLNAEKMIDLVRRDATNQIERAVSRAEAAEDRAVRAERSAGEAWDAAASARREAMDSAAAVRRMTNAILSPYASLEGLRAMVTPESGANGARI